MISNRDDTIRIDTKSFEYITKLILIEKNELFFSTASSFSPGTASLDELPGERLTTWNFRSNIPRRVL